MLWGWFEWEWYQTEASRGIVSNELFIVVRCMAYDTAIMQSCAPEITFKSCDCCYVMSWDSQGRCKWTHYELICFGYVSIWSTMLLKFVVSSFLVQQKLLLTVRYNAYAKKYISLWYSYIYFCMNLPAKALKLITAFWQIWRATMNSLELEKQILVRGNFPRRSMGFCLLHQVGNN